MQLRGIQATNGSVPGRLQASDGRVYRPVRADQQPRTIIQTTNTIRTIPASTANAITVGSTQSLGAAPPSGRSQYGQARPTSPRGLRRVNSIDRYQDRYRDRYASVPNSPLSLSRSALSRLVTNTPQLSVDNTYRVCIVPEEQGRRGRGSDQRYRMSSSVSHDGLLSVLNEESPIDPLPPRETRLTRTQSHERLSSQDLQPRDPILSRDHSMQSYQDQSMQSIDNSIYGPASGSVITRDGLKNVFRRQASYDGGATSRNGSREHSLEPLLSQGQNGSLTSGYSSEQFSSRDQSRGSSISSHDTNGNRNPSRNGSTSTTTSTTGSGNGNEAGPLPVKERLAEEYKRQTETVRAVQAVFNANPGETRVDMNEMPNHPPPPPITEDALPPPYTPYESPYDARYEQQTASHRFHTNPRFEA